MNHLIVDTRHGGLDGWYFDLAMGERSCAAWKLTLGHSDVVLVQTSEQGTPIGNCFLSDRRSNGNVHGAPSLDRPAPKRTSDAIQLATSVLGDLYEDPFTDGLNSLQESCRELARIVGRLR
jgi:hypothetical protein